MEKEFKFEDVDISMYDQGILRKDAMKAVENTGYLNLNDEQANIAAKLGLLSPDQKEDYLMARNSPWEYHLYDIPRSLRSGVVKTLDSTVEAFYDISKLLNPTLPMKVSKAIVNSDYSDLVEFVSEDFKDHIEVFDKQILKYKSPFISGQLTDGLANAISSIALWERGLAREGIAGFKKIAAADIGATLVNIEQNEPMSVSLLRYLAQGDTESTEALEEFLKADPEDRTMMEEAKNKLLMGFESLALSFGMEKVLVPAGKKGIEFLGEKIGPLFKNLSYNLIELAEVSKRSAEGATQVDDMLFKTFEKRKVSKFDTNIPKVDSEEVSVTFEVDPQGKEILTGKETITPAKVDEEVVEDVLTMPDKVIENAQEAGKPFNVSKGGWVSTATQEATGLKTLIKEYGTDTKPLVDQIEEGIKYLDNTEAGIAKELRNATKASKVMEYIDTNLTPKFLALIEDSGKNIAKLVESNSNNLEEIVPALKELLTNHTNIMFNMGRIHSNAGKILNKARLFKKGDELRPNNLDEILAKQFKLEEPIKDTLSTIEDLFDDVKNVEIFKELLGKHNGNTNRALGTMLSLNDFINKGGLHKAGKLLQESTVANILSDLAIGARGFVEGTAIVGKRTLEAVIGSKVIPRLVKIKDPEIKAQIFAQEQFLSSLRSSAVEAFDFAKEVLALSTKEDGAKAIQEAVENFDSTMSHVSAVAPDVDKYTGLYTTAEVVRESSTPDGMFYSLRNPGKKRDATLFRMGLKALMSAQVPVTKGTFGSFALVDKLVGPITANFLRKQEYALEAYKLHLRNGMPIDKALAKITKNKSLIDEINSASEKELIDIYKNLTEVDNATLLAERSVKEDASKALNLIDLETKFPKLASISKAFSNTGLDVFSLFIRPATRGGAILMEELGIFTTKRGNFRLTPNEVKYDKFVKASASMSILGMGFTARMAELSNPTIVEAKSGTSRYDELSSYVARMGPAGVLFYLGGMMGDIATLTYDISKAQAKDLESFYESVNVVVSQLIKDTTFIESIKSITDLADDPLGKGFLGIAKVLGNGTLVGSGAIRRLHKELGDEAVVALSNIERMNDFLHKSTPADLLFPEPNKTRRDALGNTYNSGEKPNGLSEILMRDYGITEVTQETFSGNTILTKKEFEDIANKYHTFMSTYKFKVKGEDKTPLEAIVDIHKNRTLAPFERKAEIQRLINGGAEVAYLKELSANEELLKKDVNTKLDSKGIFKLKKYLIDIRDKGVLEPKELQIVKERLMKLKDIKE